MPDIPDISSTAAARRRLYYRALYFNEPAQPDPSINAAQREAIQSEANRAAHGYTSTWPGPGQDTSTLKD